MIFLKESLLKEIRAHVAAHPHIEACGILSSPASPDHPERFYPMGNSAASREYFQFDSQEQFEVFQAIEDAGEQICAVFHSHLDSEAYPSRTDRLHLGNMGPIHQIICSYDSVSRTIEERSFLIARDLVLEERIKII